MTHDNAETSATDSEQLWTVTEAAEYLNVAPESVYALVSSGRIPSHKLRQRLRFIPSEVREAVKGGR